MAMKRAEPGRRDRPGPETKKPANHGGAPALLDGTGCETKGDHPLLIAMQSMLNLMPNASLEVTAHGEHYHP